jgi:hypothetical protein
MFPAYAHSVQFFKILFDLDFQHAQASAAQNCSHCQAPLHRADYPRKPRGGPSSLPKSLKRRFSFCCSRDGCRKRHTPASVRFLGRRVYFTVAFVLLATLAHGLNPRRLKALRLVLDVDRRTLQRWRDFWSDKFLQTPFWIDLRARFSPPLDETRLPISWFKRIEASGPFRMLALLRTLAAFPDPPDHSI